MVKSGELERAAFGVYILPDELADNMFIAQLRRPKIIYSHETALFLHDLTDRDPLSYTVTVPAGYNIAQLRKEGFTVFSVMRSRTTSRQARKTPPPSFFFTKLTTMFGHTVIVYGLERTICDCIRSRNRTDIAVVTDAVKRYVLRKDKDLYTLYENVGTSFEVSS